VRSGEFGGNQGRQRFIELDCQVTTVLVDIHTTVGQRADVVVTVHLLQIDNLQFQTF
jgi:hypothetical protein